MLEYLKEEANYTLTENGGLTHLTTKSDCLDLFATIGAVRRASDEEIISRFIRAYAENRDTAMKILFFARDIRGGLGERRVFRVILKWLADHEPESVRRNVAYVAEYGRYDDLLSLMGTSCEGDALDFIKTQLESDNESLKSGGTVSLLAKWLPSVNASSNETVINAKKVARHLGMSDAEYRKTLTARRARIKIIENNLREKDYTFDYSKQPSKAMTKYRKAFIRNDNERYNAFLEAVKAGTAKLNTSTLSPYEIISPLFFDNITSDDRAAIDVTWRSQPDYGNGENALVVIDGSGSMYSAADPIPAAVALSLGIYFAERNRGVFKNHFITFSENPRLVEIKGEDIFDKVMYCQNFDEIANTNVKRVFELILNTAKKHNLPASELPSKIIIVSDMEFDFCVDGISDTHFAYAKRIFDEAGYELPDVVFWNVCSRNTHQPVTVNDRGVALVSGCTPRIFSMIASGTMNPLVFMLEVVESERYACIKA